MGNTRKYRRWEIEDGFKYMTPIKGLGRILRPLQYHRDQATYRTNSLDYRRGNDQLDEWSSKTGSNCTSGTQFTAEEIPEVFPVKDTP